MRVERTLRSCHGTSAIEILTAMVVTSLTMVAGYSCLISQMRAHASQTQMADTINQARVALQTMADQIAQAGYGVPTATAPSVAPKLVTATSTQLTFWTKVDAAHTFLTANALKNATSVTVLSATGLKAGTSIYITDTTDWYFGTVQQISGNTVGLSPALTYNFVAGSPVTPVEQVTFQLAGSDLQRNGHRFIGNVTALGFSYDSVTLSTIRQITIQLSLQTQRVSAFTGTKSSVSTTTRITPPNLAL